MKIIFYLLVSISTIYWTYSYDRTYPLANQTTMDLTRKFGKDIFELNGTKFLQPLVISLNSTSNAGFYNSAYIPNKVDKPYFKVSVRGMYGIVRSDQKEYVPSMPNDTIDYTKLTNYVTLDLSDLQNIKIKSIQDTAGLIYYIFKVYIHQGIATKIINIPNKASTILGYSKAIINLPRNSLDSLVHSYPIIPLTSKTLYGLLSDSMKKYIDNTIGQFPETFTLPTGANINSLYAGVPQIEIGSLWGTELLIRLIPPVYMGVNIGNFAFWGVGINHSLSQYLNNPPFDLSIQGIYQGSYLKNKVGVTQSDLNAYTTMLNLNLHGSIKIKDWFDLYTGISFEKIFIRADYKYYLSVETQCQLGLLGENIVGYLDPNNPIYVVQPPDPAHGFPGDTLPQSTTVRLEDFSVKWTLGINKTFGPLSFFLDYSLSKFNLFSAGISYVL